MLTKTEAVIFEKQVFCFHSFSLQTLIVRIEEWVEKRVNPDVAVKTALSVFTVFVTSLIPSLVFCEWGYLTRYEEGFFGSLLILGGMEIGIITLLGWQLREIFKKVKV